MDKKIKKDIENYAENSNPIKFRKNDLIYRPGDKCENALYIQTGFVRVYCVCRDGQEVTIHIFKPQSFVPLNFCPAETKFSYYFEALTPVEIRRVSRGEFNNYLLENRELLFGLASSIFLDFKKLLGKIEQLASGDAYAKVVSALLSLVNSEKVQNVTLSFPVTHRLLSTMTGLTRETVTLQMLKLKKKGYLSGKGRHLVITDLERLMEESNCPEDCE